ncbi:MAG TPA: DMT family transporter [Aliidongia sp.]|uniref:DMT family transporter n=1 Tax=Aliidongia sp. TaxID=1914230 RepID=UPI002DDD0AA0|nr:DMT family transporter [Aliidongia sp.]HEV2674417.1 DMT family transporter [Aliidongia sp.]
MTDHTRSRPLTVRTSSSPTISPRTFGVICLLVTGIGWAFNWPSMKFLLHVWPPLFSRGLAGVLSATALAVVAHQRGESLKVPGVAVPRLLFAAFTNVFAWMGFSSLCMKWVPVGEGALLVYTMPIWTTLFAWPFLGMRPTARGFAALLLGLAGVMVLLGGQEFAIDAGKLYGVAFALGAAVLFALGAVLNRTPLPVTPIALTAWQVGLGCLPMVLLGLAFEHPDLGALTPAALGTFVYMTIFPMGVCYLTWFAALRRLPPAAASTAMLLVPIVGVISAAIMLGEPLGLREVSAMILTLSGVVLALRQR